MDEKEIREQYRKINHEIDEGKRTKEDWALFEAEKELCDMGDFKDLDDDCDIFYGGGDGLVITKAEYIEKRKQSILKIMDRLGIEISFEEFCDVIRETNPLLS